MAKLGKMLKWSDLKKWGCPKCGCMHGESWNPSNGIPCFSWHCTECWEEVSIFRDDIAELLLEHPRKGIAPHDIPDKRPC